MRRAFLVVVGAAVLIGIGWLALTSAAPGSWVASWAPCPRNWAWVPAWLPRASPLDSVVIRFADGRAKLCYGRPSLRGRTMIGGDAVPFGRLWRTGANEPTTLHLDQAVEMDEIFLAPGSYSIYTVPGPESWEVVVNRATDQWGLESEYTEAVAANEVGRLRVPAEKLERPVETLTFRAVPAGGDLFWLALEWQTTRIRIPIDGGADRVPTPGPDRQPF
ncbi:MAG TPA: DUF2911 domain-containing protein [Thermoanaerobaculia bacterium]|nr:DUF2911 domain-containing protein [Thermoanaerobaculia bacterium]